MNLQFCMEIRFLSGRISSLTLSVSLLSVVTVMHENVHVQVLVEEAKHIGTKNLNRFCS